MNPFHRDAFLVQVLEADLQVLQFLHPHDGVREVLGKILPGCMQIENKGLAEYSIARQNTVPPRD